MVVVIVLRWWMQTKEHGAHIDMLYTSEQVQCIADLPPLAMKPSHFTAVPRTCLAEAGRSMVLVEGEGG